MTPKTKGKTRDGVRIKNIEKVARALQGVTLRDGRNHTTILNYEGMRPCPVARSTNARTMLVPWLQEITGYSADELYNFLKTGRMKYAR